MTSPLLILALAPSLGFAQDNFDATGSALVPGAGGTHDALRVYSATRNRPGALAISGVFEYATNPFNLVTIDDATGQITDSDPRLADLLGLNLGVRYAVGPRLGLTASMPLWFSSSGPGGAEGPAAGDLRLSAPVNLILRDPDELGLGLAVVPYGTLPTSGGRGNLGSSQPSVGAMSVLTIGGDRWSASANLGVAQLPQVGEELAGLTMEGGRYTTAGLSAGVDLTEHLGVVAELNGRTPLGQTDHRGNNSPLEASAALRYATDSGVGLTLGAARGLLEGAGASSSRVFVGATFALPQRGLEPKAEVAETSLVVTVVTQDGSPIAGATVELEHRELIADSAGQARFLGLRPAHALALDASARSFQPVSEQLDLVAGENQRMLILDPLDGTLKVIAMDEHGAPVDARVRFLAGPADHAMVSLGEQGESSFGLAPGAWRVLVAAGDHVPEDRTVTLDPGEFETLVVRFSDEKRLNVCEGDVTLHNVNFDFDQDNPRADSLPVLSGVARTLLDCPDITVEVGGHTDWIDTDEYNILLSQRRMNSVKAILVGYGVPADRLVPVGYGESQPIAPNSTDAGRAQNRRVEFHRMPGGVAQASR